MSKQDETDKKALLADSLKRQGMTKAEIAEHLGITEQQVRCLLARASRYYRNIVKNFDQEQFLGESMVALSWLEREALNNLEAADAADLIAVEWLQAALDIRTQLVELMQIVAFGKAKSAVSGTKVDDRKSRREKTRTRLRKLDQGKGRNLHCVRSESQSPKPPDSKGT